MGIRRRGAAGSLVSVVLAAIPASGQSAPATNAAGISSLTPITIYRDSKRYNSFPDVTRLPDGRLLCVFRDATFPKQIRHIEADARVVGCVSEDQGRTWSKPEVIYDDPACQNDPSVAVLKDGRLLLTFFNWVGRSAEYAAAHKTHQSRKVDRGPWGEYAEPGGVYLLWGRARDLKWDKEATHVAGDAAVLRGTSAAVLETRKGTLLMPIYGRSEERRVKNRRRDVGAVLRSVDGGKTWGNEIVIAEDPGRTIDMGEPALAQAANGDIVALLRTANAEDHLFITRSADDGMTWSTIAQTGLIGHPAALQLLPDGRLLIVYGYRHAPFGVRGCISMDDGKTWYPSKVFTIAATGVQTDLGYPSVCLTNDNHAVVAYYMNGRDTKDRWIECKRIPLSSLE
ncbi:MAG TPA: sialidase family protein [Phycisphaerae bacterium]|nr:sialidase family protein [Phycisphaerae bacterium]HRY70535.1 sialidase family protein [Phycisphaerae bacterium]HSA27983.1 sialidase family protein [Phycisphaerae bacterium]